MTELGEDTQPAMCYPNEAQYQQWKDWADEMGYKSVSRFMIEMVEVGYKQIDLAIGYDEDTKELREQRNNLKQELDKTRNRLQEVEEQLYSGEREVILDLLEEQPNGASFAQIVQHVIDDTPVRVAKVLDELDGDEISHREGRYLRSGSSNE